MESKENRKTKRFTIRLSKAEFEYISRKCKSSTCRKLSEYVRIVLLGKTAITVTRNGSLDELMGEMTRVRAELNRIGVNANQATKRLHTLTQINEFRTHLEQQEHHNLNLQKAISEALVVINKLADQWLR